MPGRVLLIESDSASRIVLRFQLERRCYTVLAVSADEAGLTQGRAFQPDLVLISDSCALEKLFDLLAELAGCPETQHAPRLVISSRIKAQDRLSLLLAGAEDVLDRETHENLISARMRGLMRRRTSTDEAIQRYYTQKELALAEPETEFQRPGIAAIVDADQRRAGSWQAALSPRLPHHLRVMSPEQALSIKPSHTAPDVFVIPVKCNVGDDGVRLISELRCHSITRHSNIIGVFEQNRQTPLSQQDHAAMVLDVGAGDVMLNGFEPTELSLRLERQIAVKKQADRLRSSVRAGLHMATCDPLTGLYNRRYAMPHLARIAAAAKDRGAPFTTMLLDLDRFKSVNDTYGHAAGDVVLQSVAARLRDNVRSHDLLARIGGEEFLIAMPDTDHREAAEAADRLRDVIRRDPISLPGRDISIQVTCSIGVRVGLAASGKDATFGDDVSAVIDEADSALYRSKADGRDMTSFARSAA